MEYQTGVKKKDTLEITELLNAKTGEAVKVNGAVHTIRDMGTVAFVILRKREGLLQCVYEEGSATFDLKEIKEASTLEVEGVLEQNEKAPNGIEIRMKKVKILSQPEDEMMPLAISKWKLNTSLEAKLNYRSISLRNIREHFVIFYIVRNLLKFIHRRLEPKVQKVVQTYLSWNISTARQCSSKVLSSTNR